MQQREVLLPDSAQQVHADMRSVLRRRDSKAELAADPDSAAPPVGAATISDSRPCMLSWMDCMACAIMARLFMQAPQQKDRSLLEQQKHTSMPPVLRLLRPPASWEDTSDRSSEVRGDSSYKDRDSATADSAASKHVFIFSEDRKIVLAVGVVSKYNILLLK